MTKQEITNGQFMDLDEEQVDFLGLATTLGQEKKIVFGLPLMVGVLAIAVSMFLPPVYTATTTLLPPSGSSGGGAAAALASLGSLGGLAGGLGAMKTPDEQYVAMLQSRTIKDALINKFDLLKKYGAEFKEDVYNKLSTITMITSDKKTGIITLQVDNKDPKFAADLANAYVNALTDLLNSVALTEAQQKRLFFETQFAKAKNDLSAAEVRMKEVQEKTGILQIQGQAEVSIRAVADVRAEIAKREVELTALKTFATVENPDYKRILGELSGLRTQLKKLEQGSSSPDNALPTDKLPAAGLEYIRALREVKYNEAIFEIMAKQFELAKIEEAKDGATIQQLDVAVPPARKSKPNKSKIVLMSVLGGLVLGVFIALMKGTLQKSRRDMEKQEKWRVFRHAWGFKSKSL